MTNEQRCTIEKIRHDINKDAINIQSLALQISGTLFIYHASVSENKEIASMFDDLLSCVDNIKSACYDDLGDLLGYDETAKMFISEDPSDPDAASTPPVAE